jgi:integrase
VRVFDRLFQGQYGGILAGSVIRRAWRSAHENALTPEEFTSPLGKRVYDLRHTCLTRWLNGGVPPAQVAEWAGNSVSVLLAIYAGVSPGSSGISSGGWKPGRTCQR